MKLLGREVRETQKHPQKEYSTVGGEKSLVLNVFNTLVSYCVLDSARSLGCNVDQFSKAP